MAAASTPRRPPARGSASSRCGSASRWPMARSRSHRSGGAARASWPACPNHGRTATARRRAIDNEGAMSGDLIRVILVDDHSVVRAGLKAVLGTAKDIDVIGEAKDGREAIALADRMRPDVIVMDLTMAGMDGMEATRE